MRRLLLGLSLVGIVSGCYVEEFPSMRERIAQEKDKKNTSLYKARECRADRSTGCLSGQVVVGQDLSVDGQNFFDADDLGRNFHKLVQLKDSSGENLSTEGYDLAISPAITNDAFGRDFEVYLKGEQVAYARAGGNGYFQVNFLREGSYEMRVQKKFTLTMKPKSASEEPRAAQAEEKSFCFVIYAEDYALEVPRGEKVYLKFDDFRLRLLDQECKSELGGPVITM